LYSESISFMCLHFLLGPKLYFVLISEFSTNAHYAI
jgi:hypothetical protein